MALFDMIHQAMTPSLDENLVHDHESDLNEEDKLALESLGLNDHSYDDTNDGNKSIPNRRLDAMEALSNIEAHKNLMNEPDPFYETLHKALEANLPTDVPPYDPTAELEEIEQSLSGIDADTTDGDKDQPQPEEELENSSTIADLMTVLKDHEADEADSKGVLNT